MREKTSRGARILTVGPSKHFFSGVTAHTIFLSNALARRNRVGVIFFRRFVPRRLYPGKGNVGRNDYSIHLHPSVEAFDGLDWNAPATWMNGVRFLMGFRPHVVILPWWTASVAHLETVLLYAAKSVGAKVVLEIHELLDPLEGEIPLWTSYANMMVRHIASRSHSVVVHSEATRGQFKALVNREHNNVHVVPFGLYQDYVDESMSRKQIKQGLGITEGLVILYFGTIRPYKGVPSLVKAFGSLPRDIASDSRLLIVGDDWGAASDVENLVKSSPHASQITYNPRFVPDSMLSSLFAIADVVVLPYKRTSGSGTLKIAMANRKIILASDIPPMREWLSGYQRARFFGVDDSDELARQLVWVYQHRHESQPVPEGVLLSQDWDAVASTIEHLALGGPSELNFS